MIAASAPENGPGSPALPAREIVDAPSGETTLGAFCPCEVAVLACRPGTTAPARSGDTGECPLFAIIGELDPIEFRFDSIAFRLRIRRMMKNASTHVVAIARKPSTTMTAMAQCGKLELLAPDWTLAPVAEAPGEKKKLGAGELYPPNEKSFTLKSQPWISPWTGNFIALGGHIHDGGVNTEIYQNNKLICDSRANYTDSSSHSRHIGSMTGCRSSAGVQAGDKFQIVVNYDFEKNPGLREKDGSLSAIMASATLFIGAV